MRIIFAWLWIFLAICAIILTGCANVVQNWKKNPETGKMELIQELKAKGIGDTKGKFEDKSEIETKAYKPIPQIPIKDIEISK